MDNLTIQILKNLMEHPYSFNELVDACPGTSRNTVRKKLKLMKTQGLIIDERPKKHSGQKEQITITQEARGVYVAQLTNNLPQQLKSIRAEINLIKSEIKKQEYQTKYKQNLEEAKTQIETRKTEIEKAIKEVCEEKGITPEQADRNLVNYAHDHFKTEKEIINFFEELEGTNLVKDLEEPLHEATKKLFELYLYFNKQHNWPEGITESHWVVFSPGLNLFSATQTLNPVGFEVTLMKMRAEEKASMAYVDETCEIPIRYRRDYDKEVKEYFDQPQNQEELKKFLKEMPWRKKTN